MAALNIKKAKRELIWVKVALMAPSGGGKTYSALRLATGMLEELKKIGQEGNGRIALLNTEQKRGYYYANEFDYDIVDVDSPHNPEKYVEYIDAIVDAGYPILIMDSTSHEWEGKGGCLELQMQAGGTYQAWGKVTPRHNKFIGAIADSPIHLIATMRGKDQYEMERSEGGKTSVKKLGVGAKQRDGFEYEFTVTFNIDQKTNMATAQKDNTHLFENEGDVKLSETFGTRLINWANSGEGYTPPVRDGRPASEVLKELQSKAVQLCSDLGGKSNEKMMEVLRSFVPGANPNKVTDVAVLQQLISSLETMEVVKE